MVLLLCSVVERFVGYWYPMSKLTKMHAEYYRNIHEHESLNGGK